MENKKLVTEGFRVGSQTPIDDRSIVKTLVELDITNINPYRCYEGMEVLCLENGSKYRWVEVSAPTAFGSFTYPSNIIVNDIDYSGKTFSFVESMSSSWVYITQADLLILKNANSLQQNQYYYITDRDIIIQAASESDFLISGTRFMRIVKEEYYINTGPAENKGVWYAGLTGLNIDDIVVWGGKCWRSVTGLLGTKINSDDLDNTNWVLIPKSNDTYYSLKSFSVIYDLESDSILVQQDNKNNSIRTNLVLFVDYTGIERTDWGSPLIFNNQVYFEISNNVGPIFDNDITGLITENIGLVYSNKNCFLIENNSGDVYNNIACGTIALNSSVYENKNIQTISNNTVPVYLNQNILSGISYNNLLSGGDIHRNRNLIAIINNSNTLISNNTNNGSIEGNSGNLTIAFNSNNGSILRNNSVSPVSITKNINNGDIGNAAFDTPRVVDVTDTIVNK